MAIPSNHANHIDTPEQLFRSLIDIAKHHAPERLYAEPVVEFTDLIVNCLLEGRDLDEIKYPENGHTFSRLVWRSYLATWSPSTFSLAVLCRLPWRPIYTGAVILALSELTGCSWTSHT
jgi:hypothetical protein